MLSEMSDEKGQELYFTHVEYKQKLTNEPTNENKLIDTDNRLRVAGGERGLGKGKVGKEGEYVVLGVVASIQYSTQMLNYNPYTQKLYHIINQCCPSKFK